MVGTYVSSVAVISQQPTVFRWLILRQCLTIHWKETPKFGFVTCLIWWNTDIIYFLLNDIIIIIIIAVGMQKMNLCGKSIYFDDLTNLS